MLHTGFIGPAKKFLTTDGHRLTRINTNILKLFEGGSQKPFWQEWSFFRLDGKNLLSAYKNRHQSVFLPDEKNPQSCFQKRF